MEKTVQYLETHSQNPYYNLAFEEYVLCHRTQGDYLLLWQNDNTIVVGQNQNTEAEINRAFVEQHHINVVRRSTGGGAVYHDLGNLNYSFITDVGDDGISIRRFTEPVVAALTGVVFFHETLSIWTLLGVACVLGGVILLAKGDDTCKESNSSTAST